MVSLATYRVVTDQSRCEQPKVYLQMTRLSLNHVLFALETLLTLNSRPTRCLDPRFASIFILGIGKLN